MMTRARPPFEGAGPVLPPLEQLDDLPEPFEILEMQDGETRQLQIVRHQLGRCWIQPRDGRPRKQVPCLRVWIPPETKPTIPDYWDVTAKHLISGLLGYLEAGTGRRYRFTTTKRGRPPVARFTLTATPL